MFYIIMNHESEVLYWLTNQLRSILRLRGFKTYQALMAKVKEPTDTSHGNISPALQSLVIFIRPGEFVYQQNSSQSSSTM